jgi:hypothetical protein
MDIFVSGQTTSVDEVKWHNTEALDKYIHNQSSTNIVFTHFGEINWYLERKKKRNNPSIDRFRRKAIIKKYSRFFY